MGELNFSTLEKRLNTVRELEAPDDLNLILSNPFKVSHFDLIFDYATVPVKWDILDRFVKLKRDASDTSSIHILRGTEDIELYMDIINGQKTNGVDTTVSFRMKDEAVRSHLFNEGVKKSVEMRQDIKKKWGEYYPAVLDDRYKLFQGIEVHSLLVSALAI